MPRKLEGMADLDRAIERAGRMAAGKQTTVYVQGSRTRGYVIRHEPDSDFRRAAKVTKSGLALYWAPSLQRYVSIPDD